MMFKTLSRAAAVLVGLLILSGPVAAQTATTSTTLSLAISDSAATQIVVASATNVEAGGALFIDREYLTVTAVNSTTVSVMRGAGGTRAAAHANASLVYVASKAMLAYVFKSSQAYLGTCTRANEAYLPQIDVSNGIVWDCPVGATQWSPLNTPGLNTARSEAFNIDNGAGTTIDAILIRHPRPILIVACRIVYEDATVGTAAAGNAKVGTTVGGAEVVAATAYTNSATVGSTTAMTIVDGKVAAATPVLVRHTGVAATVAGEAVVECDYLVR
jgi:hypothetical protein